MQESRVEKRNSLIYYLRVHDCDTGRLLGRVVDITTGGIRLYSNDRIEPDKTFNLRMDIPGAAGQERHLIFEASSIWCRRSANPDFYETGFQTSSVSPEDSAVIESLIRDSWAGN